MVADPGGIKRVVNAYVARRLDPLQQVVEHNSSELAQVRSDVEALRDELLQERERFEALRGDLLGERRRVEALLGTVNLLARRGHRSGRIRCLFLIHYMEAWDSLADVIEEMREAEDFEPIVASIPRRLPGAPGFQDEELTHQRLNALGAPHLRFEGDDTNLTLDTIKQLEPDLIFRQSQWDVDVPLAFSTGNLSFARLALIPYEVFNPIENVPAPAPIRDSATDSRFHRNCWAVFCANQMVRARAVESTPASGAAQYVVTGHPKLQRLRRALAASPNAKPGSPFTVMWNAHHSIGEDWTRFGLFPTMAPEMVAWARARPDMRFVFSPHPSLLTVLESAEPPLTPEFVAGFWEQWNALPNTEFDPGGDTGTYGELFARCDVCVSDGISMLVEFQIANKPVIHVAREGHRPFNELGRVAERGFHTVATTEEARSLVERFAAGEPDPLADAQEEVVAELFGEHDAAREIVAYIRENWDTH